VFFSFSVSHDIVFTWATQRSLRLSKKIALIKSLKAFNLRVASLAILVCNIYRAPSSSHHRLKEEKNNDVTMGLRFQQAVTLEAFLDGYNAQLTLYANKVSSLTLAEKSKRSSYINYWNPFAMIFGDALAEFEELFGEKAGEYIAEYELAMEEALEFCSSRGAERKYLLTTNAGKRSRPFSVLLQQKSAHRMRVNWNLKRYHESDVFEDVYGVKRNRSTSNFFDAHTLMSMSSFI